MKFVAKILDFLKSLLPGKPDKTKNNKEPSESIEGAEKEDSALKTFALKSAKFIFKYLKKFVIFILGLILAMAQPMINIAKKHPIAFLAAIIFIQYYCMDWYIAILIVGKSLRKNLLHLNLHQLKQ